MIISLTQYADIGWWAMVGSVAIVFLYHGWAKVKNPMAMAPVLGGSKTLGGLFGAVEMLAGVALLTSFATEGALVIAAIMLAAMYFKISKWHVSFWSQTNTGWEFDFVLFCAALAIATH